MSELAFWSVTVVAFAIILLLLTIIVRIDTKVSNIETMVSELVKNDDYIMYGESRRGE